MESWWSRSKGSRTRGENIADTTGMQAVFQAYKKLKKPHGESRLPGLEEFTDDQLFFLSFAAVSFIHRISIKSVELYIELYMRWLR